MRNLMKRLSRGAGLGLVALTLSLAGCFSDDAASPADPGDTGASAAEDAGAADTGAQTAEPDAGAPGEDIAVEAPAPAWKASFQPEASAPEGSWIRADMVQLDARRVAVEVHAGGFDSVFGIAFRLRWDPTLLKWAGGEAKDVLSSSKATGITAMVEREPGELVYGHALFPNPSNNNQGPSSLAGAAIGDALLLRIELDVEAAGTTGLTFVDESRDVRSPDGEQLPLTWSAGSLAIEAVEPVEGGAL